MKKTTNGEDFQGSEIIVRTCPAVAGREEEKDY